MARYNYNYSTNSESFYCRISPNTHLIMPPCSSPILSSPCLVFQPLGWELFMLLASCQDLYLWLRLSAPLYLLLYKLILHGIACMYMIIVHVYQILYIYTCTVHLALCVIVLPWISRVYLYSRAVLCIPRGNTYNCTGLKSYTLYWQLHAEYSSHQHSLIPAVHISRLHL